VADGGHLTNYTYPPRRTRNSLSRNPSHADGEYRLFYRQSYFRTESTSNRKRINRRPRPHPPRSLRPSLGSLGQTFAVKCNCFPQCSRSIIRRFCGLGTQQSRLSIFQEKSDSSDLACLVHNLRPLLMQIQRIVTLDWKLRTYTSDLRRCLSVVSCQCSHLPNTLMLRILRQPLPATLVEASLSPAAAGLFP
jgi:hypothetical protein